VIHKFGKYKTTNKTLLNHFPCRLSYGRTAYHLPGKNRKVSGTRPTSQPCAEHLNFASVQVVIRIVIIICSLVYRSVYGFTELITQQCINPLSNSICRHERNVLLLSNVARQSLPVAGACSVKIVS
jgi:hypothetical protein